jgi:hypothetical protein
MRQNESVFENKISYTQTYKDKKVLLTPKVLGYSTLGFFVLGMILYIAIQLAAFTGTPNLAIASPANNVIVDVDNIDLSGITDGDTIIKVNEEKVPVTSGGHFSLNLKLHQGVNVIQVQAINKLEKETSKVYTIEYRPKTAALSMPAEQ